MTGVQLAGDMDAVMSYMHEFYFETAATILTLITVGKMLESRSKGKTTDALKGLMKLAPKTATILENGAATMSISSFLVVTNALRLNLFKVHDTRKDKKLKQKTAKKEYTTIQEKKLNI